MADEKPRLGRGLDSLISAARTHELSRDVAQKAGLRVLAIPTATIQPNPFQPRKEFDVQALQDLITSLQVHGLMQPIVVRQAGGKCELVAGERRWRAAQELGWPTMDAVVIEADDRRMLEWALVENIQRQELGPLELARAFRQLAEEFKLTQDGVARAVGMSRPAVTNLLRLLDLPDGVQDQINRGSLSAGAARALLALPNEADMTSMAEKIQQEGLSVREVERAVKAKLERPPAPERTLAPPSAIRDPNLSALVDRLQQSLGTKVTLQGTARRGRLTLAFHSPAELDRLVRRLYGGAPALAEVEEAGDLTV